MFEARRQLLKLPSTGIKTPSSTSSPVNLSTTPNISVTPIIRLPQSQSPHIKPQYIGNYCLGYFCRNNHGYAKFCGAGNSTTSTFIIIVNHLIQKLVDMEMGTITF